MKKLKSLVASTLALAMLVGCGGGDTAGSNTITVAKENDVSTLDLKIASTGMDFEVINAYTDGLVWLDKDSVVQPALAESWDVSDDNLVYTFHLRDAKWSNGDPVTAADFVYSWQRTLKDGVDYQYFFTDDMACIKNGNEIYGALQDGKEVNLDDLGIKAIDDKTLEVTLSQPIPYFLSLMAFPTAFPMNEKFVTEKGDSYATSADTVISCGAYVLTNWAQGSTLEFEKNPDYWDVDSIKLDKLVMRIIPEASTAALDFDSGNLDFTKINSSLIDKYKDSDEIGSFLEGYLWFLQFNVDGNEILQNANVRKALSLAIDRDDLVNNILKDGSVAARGFMPSGFAFDSEGKDYAETAPKLTDYNVEQAQAAWQEALKELGTDKVTLDLLYETADPSRPAAEFVQNQLQKNLPGLTITMTGVNEKKARTTKQADGDFDITVTRWGPDYADPTTYLTLLTTGHYFNYGKWVNDEYTSMVQSINSEGDLAKRWQLCQDAEKLLMSDGNIPVDPLFQTGSATLISKDVSGIESHSFGTPYVYRNATRN